MYWLPFLSAPHVPACRDVINAAQRYEAKCVVIWCNGISMFVHLMSVCHDRAGLGVARWKTNYYLFIVTHAHLPISSLYVITLMTSRRSKMRGSMSPRRLEIRGSMPSRTSEMRGSTSSANKWFDPSKCEAQRTRLTSGSILKPQLLYCTSSFFL